MIKCLDIYNIMSGQVVYFVLNTCLLSISLNCIFLLYVLNLFQMLAERRTQSEDIDMDPLVWTTRRVMKWARSIDLNVSTHPSCSHTCIFICISDLFYCPLLFGIFNSSLFQISLTIFLSYISFCCATYSYFHFLNLYNRIELSLSS